MSRFVLTAQLQLQAPNNVAQVVRQIQSQLNNVNVNIQVQNAPQAQRQIQQITNQTNQAATAAERMGRAFAVSVRRFAAFSIATRAVGLFTSTLSDAVQTAIDFERQLIKVSQVTGKSVGQLRDLTNEITKLSTGLGVSSNSLLEVSTVLAQAGLSANDTKVALNSLAKAALAPNFDSITETAEGAIAILAQFGQGVKALEGQLGSINAVAGAFAVEASDLIDVIRRTGGVFKSSGGNLNELLALFTSVRATTRESAESIGTGLRTIFTRIQRPKTIEFLKQFGVELVDLEGKFVGPFEAVKRLSEALTGLGERDITFIQIAEELGGFRQIGKVLPLLQQFSVAQAALNVATKSGNSLTADAISAQAALAIRIIKVKEEFLALVRSITETSTFQAFANTALSLASSLIKLADSIKPLLPLLGALAAFKIAKGFGQFAGGILGGLGSSRTFNQGGRVHKFARGGLVPGSGNRDTVPAMLSPGEFVIRKSSVNRLGASNLAAMNENRYAQGGRTIVGATQKLKSTQKRDSKYGANKAIAGSGSIQFDVNDGQIGAFVLTPPKGTEGGYTATQPFPFTLPANNKYAKLAASQAGLSDKDIQGGVNAVINPATYPVFFPGMQEGKRNLENNAKYAAAAHKGFLDGISTGVNSTVQSVASQGLLDLPPALNTNENLMKGIIGKIQSDGQVRSTIEGYLFEAMISAFTGASAAGGRANFDFPRSAISQNKDKLAALFGSPSLINKLIKAEAKRGYGEVGGNIQRKLANDIIAGYKGGVTLKTTGTRKRFASGGGVGTDTVPALLTPGEFVVNRSSAQRIGYGNLNRMNKVGRYANGGIVQQFRNGTAGSGATATASGGGQQVFYTAAQQVTTFGNACGSATQAQQQQRKSILQTVESNKFFALSMTAGLMQSFLPALDESSSAITKLSHGFFDIVTTITSVGFALEAFGIAISASTAKMVAQNAIDFLTGAKSLKDLFTTIKGGIPGLKSFSTIFQRGMSGRVAAAGGSGISRAIGQAGNLVGRATGGTGTVGGLLQTTGQLPGIRNVRQVGRSFASGYSAAGYSNTAQAYFSRGASPLMRNISAGATRFGARVGNIANEGSAIKSAFTLGSRGSSLYSMGGGKVPLQYKAANILGQGAGRVGGVAGRIASSGVGKAVGGAVGSAGRAIGGAASGVAAKAGLSGGLISGIAGNLNKLAGSALGFGIALQAGSALLGSFTDYQGKANKAIAEGNIDKAKSNAVEAAGADAVDNLLSGFMAVSAAIPIIGPAAAAATAALVKVASEVPVIGPAIKRTAISIGVAFGGKTLASIEANAEAQAQAAKTQKAFQQGQIDATNAMAQFEAGSISASEALSKIQNVSEQNQNLQKANAKNIQENLKNKSTGVLGFGRNVLSLGGYNPLMESAGARNARIDKENAQTSQASMESQAKAFEISKPLIMANMRQGLAQGLSRQQIEENIKSKGGMTPEDLRRQMASRNIKATEAEKAGDTETAKIFRKEAELFENQAKELDIAFKNLSDETERTKAAFEAMNLSMQNVQGAASAAALNVSNYVEAQKAGNIGLKQSLATLEASVTSAAKGISDADFDAAFKDAEQTLRGFGASDKQIEGFKENIQSVNAVQKNSAKIFSETKSKLQKAAERGGGRSAEESKKAFKEVIGEQLKGQYSEGAIKRIQAQVDTLSQEQLNEIGTGNFSVFNDAIGDMGKKVLDQVNGPLNDAIKIQEELNNLTKQRIEAERNLIEAQVESLNVRMEARDIQAKYGGKAVTAAERRQNIINVANTQGRNVTGVGALTTGSAADIQRRSAEIAARQAELGNVRNLAAAGDKGAMGQLQGQGGLQLEEEERKLAQAAKDQLNATRELIKAKEQELQIVQEKNKLEKQSLESLISGDIEKFFEQQAAVGATAAIATGNQDVMNQFGASALAGAYSDIQRQQEAGVQSIYGQQIAGPGGLGEKAANAALAARGVQSPLAAQVMAGTTPEQEALKSEIRALADTMGPTADLQTQAADLQLQAAQMQLQAAQARGEAAVAQTQAREMARGGMVYASRGIFVPRGTDTVPAMLTPGEFVVNRNAVNRGNNLQLLQAMNSGNGSSSGGQALGMSRGGRVQYLAEGSQRPVSGGGGFGSIDPKVLTDFSASLNKFNGDLEANITKLKDTKFKITLDSTNININLTGTSFLAGLKESIQKDLFSQIGQEISNYKVGAGGKLTKSEGVLNSYT